MASDENDRRPKPRVVAPPARGKEYGRQSGNKARDQIMGGIGLFGNTIVDPLRQGANFMGDLTNFVLNRPAAGQDKGVGDQLFGPRARILDRGVAGTSRARGPRTASKMPMNPIQEEEERGLSDFLREAMDILGAGGGPGGVDYSPQRNTLRGNAAENDARLEAMYRQLRGSIDADAPVIQQAYQQAIDATASNSANAQAQTQAAADAAMARNNEVLGNLGIEQAQGNIIQQGTDLNSQAAGNIAAQASKGQAAGDRLVSNQATALSHNTNIGNAAGLEGNLQRASNQARLQALLADIDMAEQEANRSSQQNNFGQQFSLAQALLGEQQYNQSRQDELEMAAAQMAADQRPGYDPNAFWQYVSQLQGINGLAPLSEDPQTQIDQLDLFRKIYQG